MPDFTLYRLDQCYENGKPKKRDDYHDKINVPNSTAYCQHRDDFKLLRNLIDSYPDLTGKPFIVEINLNTIGRPMIVYRKI